MSISVGECPLGVFAFDEDGKIVKSKEFPRGVRELSGKLSVIREGKITDEHLELIKELLGKGYENFNLESKDLVSQLRENFPSGEFDTEVPNSASVKLRKSLREIAEEEGVENVNELLRNVNILMTREELRREASERDKIVIESINTMDDLDKTINTLYGRVTEWYGIHFPELDRYISEPTKYLKLISELGRRRNFTEENLAKLNIGEEKAKEIQEDAEESIGAQFDDLDIKAIQASVNRILKLQEARDEVSEYLDGLMEQVAPNIKTLVGAPIGARLISLAGSLDKLAKMPSSTLQVLGAEKALFRSLHSDAKPPKHGVIFQYPEIRKSPNHQRGKIARALAGKLTIAARVDAMSGRFVGDELKKELEERISSIKSDE